MCGGQLLVLLSELLFRNPKFLESHPQIFHHLVGEGGRIRGRETVDPRVHGGQTVRVLFGTHPTLIKVGSCGCKHRSFKPGNLLLP
jgi:hypothetical protein